MYLEKIEAQLNYFIKIISNKVIGMMKNEMINNLGIIVKWNTVLIMDIEKIEAQPKYLIKIIPDKA
eukprot:9345282-Heterocapsa_arctica.AAC.1